MKVFTSAAGSVSWNRPNLFLSPLLNAGLLRKCIGCASKCGLLHDCSTHGKNLIIGKTNIQNAAAVSLNTSLFSRFKCMFMFLQRGDCINAFYAHLSLLSTALAKENVAVYSRRFCVMTRLRCSDKKTRASHA